METTISLLEDACIELESCGRPELANEVRAIIAKVEMMENTAEAVEEESEEEMPAEEE